jgi:hypothetical protein
MTTPLQGNPLARIQPAKASLPSLEQMRADLLKLEIDQAQQPLVRMLAGSQRTLIDHMRRLAGDQKTLRATTETKFRGLVEEVTALLNPPADEPHAVETQAEQVDPVAPAAQAPTAPEAPPTAHAEMTVTPKPRARRQSPGGAQ